MAERNLTSGQSTAISASKVRPALFFEGEYNGGTLRLWSGVGPISWNGNTWTGAGNLASISEIKESAFLKAIGFTVKISGMPSTMIGIALSNFRQGKPGTLWLGCLDENEAIISDPYQLQRGRFDIGMIEDTGTTCSISINYESRLIDLERPRERRYTDEDQNIDDPTDTGFWMVGRLQDTVVRWGE